MSKQFEFAASFPTEAERSLLEVRSTIRRTLPGNRKLNEEEVQLVSEPGEEGWWWEILISDSIRQELLSAQRSMISQLSSDCHELIQTDEKDWQYCVGVAVFVGVGERVGVLLGVADSVGVFVLVGVGPPGPGKY